MPRARPASPQAQVDAVGIRRNPRQARVDREQIRPGLFEARLAWEQAYLNLLRA
jgi:hypothetical protein